MKSKIGLWVDHRKAIIVIVTDEDEEIKQINSDIEGQVRYSTGRSNDDSAEDVRDRQYDNRLNRFYDDIIVCLRDAETIQIFGPGEAKGELEARIDKEGLKGRIIEVETVDKMTDRQIAAKVRQHFHH